MNERNKMVKFDITFFGSDINVTNEHINYSTIGKLSGLQCKHKDGTLEYLEILEKCKLLHKTLNELKDLLL